MLRCHRPCPVYASLGQSEALVVVIARAQSVRARSGPTGGFPELTPRELLGLLLRATLPLRPCAQVAKSAELPVPATPLQEDTWTAPAGRVQDGAPGGAQALAATGHGLRRQQLARLVVLDHARGLPPDPCGRRAAASGSRVRLCSRVEEIQESVEHSKAVQLHGRLQWRPVRQVRRARCRQHAAVLAVLGVGNRGTRVYRRLTACRFH